MRKYLLQEIEHLWLELGDVPFDEDKDGELILADDWHIFYKGTSREDIWHWFDDKHPIGLYALMGLNNWTDYNDFVDGACED